MNTSFKYVKSYLIPYRNCLYDSLLELKYALSIEKDYRYLREPFRMGDDPKTFTITQYSKEEIKIYKPDFLVRSKTSGHSWLMEIKPTAFQYCPEVVVYQQIANNYLQYRRLDSQFQIVYEKDIRLQPAQQEKYNLFVKHKNIFAHTFAFQRLDRKYNSMGVQYFSQVPTFPEDPLNKKEYARFVHLGI